MKVLNEGTRRWLALGALALAMMTIGLDVTVLTIALPTLAVDLHANTSELQWFSTAYTLVLAAAMLPAGALGDRYGRKKVLLAALLLFGLSSAACAVAVSAGQLIAARAVLGLAAAAMMPLSLAVLPVLFPEPAARTRAMTIWVTANGIGMPLGPLLGGWLLRNFWWGSVFLINVPVVILGALAVAFLVPESRSEQRRPIDLVGVALSSAGLLGLTYGFIRAGQEGWSNGPAWLTIAIGAGLLAGFLAWQRRAASPLIDLGLFANGQFRWGTVYSVLVMFAMFGMFFTVPQYFQAVLGVDALGSGIRLLPLIGGLVVGAKVGEAILTKAGAAASEHQRGTSSAASQGDHQRGVKPVLLAGFALLAAGLGMGALTTVGTGYGYTAMWIVVTGLGMGFTMPTAMGMALGTLTAERSGSGSALMQALRQAGGTIGVAVLGTVMATHYRTGLGADNRPPLSQGVNAGVAVAHKLGNPAMLGHVQSAFVGGMNLMLWVCAAIALASMVVAAVFTPRRTETVENQVSGAESVHVG